MFVLAMEYLSRLIKANIEYPDFNFHPKCEKIGLTHLAFADDIILFARGDVQSVNIVFQSLIQFGQCSGLDLYINKSNLFAVGISDVELYNLQQVIGLPIGEFCVKYLGSQLVHGKIKVVHFNPLIEKIGVYQLLVHTYIFLCWQIGASQICYPGIRILLAAKLSHSFYHLGQNH